MLAGTISGTIDLLALLEQNGGSMERKTKVNLGGQMRDAEQVPVQSSEERWNQYLLEDGTVLKMKIVVTEVYRVDGIYDQDGNPVYHVKSTNVASADAPENLKQHK